MKDICEKDGLNVKYDSQLSALTFKLNFKNILFISITYHNIPEEPFFEASVVSREHATRKDVLKIRFPSRQS